MIRPENKIGWQLISESPLIYVNLMIYNKEKCIDLEKNISRTLFLLLVLCRRKRNVMMGYFQWQD